MGSANPDSPRERKRHVGDRRAYGGLTVFWLGAPAAPAPFAIVTLDEARAKGGFFVTERDQAAVSGLVVENRGPVHVLLLAGEILQGGKQNRIVVTPSWIDLFQDDSLFAREWSKLLGASTIDAYGRRIADSEEARPRATLDEILKLAAGADGAVRRGVGAGWLVELSMSRAKGSALVAERQVVHLAMI
jgi:hypothetical protein